MISPATRLNLCTCFDNTNFTYVVLAFFKGVLGLFESNTELREREVSE